MKRTVARKNWAQFFICNFAFAQTFFTTPLSNKINLTLRPLIYCMFFSTYYLYNINFIITLNDLINERMRLAVHKQSFSNLLEQNGCRVTKVYYSKIPGISKKEQFIPAGLKCRAQVTGQVTGYRPQVRSQATDHRSHKKTIGHWTKLFWTDVLLYKNEISQGTLMIFLCFKQC